MGIIFSITGIFFLFLTILMIRAACFRPKSSISCPSEPLSFDRDRAISGLQELIRCKTVSNSDPDLENHSEFEKLLNQLPALYPAVFEVCSVQTFPQRGLLLHWKGKDHRHPTVLMAHYDVVPAEEAAWNKPPFDGVIENGVLWGRGTLDTKATFHGILFAAEQLIKDGFQPEHDCYFAFSGSEEINGNGAKYIVDHFIREGIEPALVLDEGGAVVENVFPGVKAPCALIGIGEKGMMNVEYCVSSQGGHASAPSPDTPIDILARACLRVRKHPFPMHINQPAKALFDTLGRHSTFLYKLVFANLWCFRPVLDLICRRSGGELNALVRTTTAFTQAEGSKARNVLPVKASLVSNMRLNPGDTVSSAQEYLRKTVADPRVQIRILEGFDPSPVSDTCSECYERLSATIAQTWPQAIISPYLMVQCSDARHYGILSNRVYRFCPMELTAEERKTIHGNNEGIRLEAICKTVEFYIRLMKQC